MATRRGMLDGMDAATAALTLSLLLQDIYALGPNFQEKNSSGKASDEEAAFQGYQSDLESVIREYQPVAHRFPREVQAAMSLAMTRPPQPAIRPLPRSTAAVSPTPGVTASTIAPTETLTAEAYGSVTPPPVSISDANASDMRQSTKSTTEDAQRIGVQETECTCCRDNNPSPDVVHLPCDHDYCGDCIQQLFTHASADESLFPPRCCTGHPLSPDSLQAFLTAEITEKHKEKEAEFSTPNRTYCSNVQCAVWLRPEQISADVGTCLVCKQKTCIICKIPAHDDFCPAEEGLEGVFEMAKKWGWQRCPNCRSMVGMSTGCNEMVCRCNTTWCYKCRAPWRTCDCERSTSRLTDANREEELIYLPASRHPQPAPLAAPPTPPAPAGPCQHGRGWHYVRGEALCGSCTRTMPDFILECNGCDRQVCVRCSRYYQRTEDI